MTSLVAPGVEVPGAAIRALRERFGLTRRQFAAILQASVPTVCRWETSAVARVQHDTAGWIAALVSMPDPAFIPLRDRVLDVFTRGEWPKAWGVWTLLGAG